ncbi:hypothetical protein SARC_00432 [Sphaeroforma arctica JP610]|uniref:Uncharacterized protein n=1 Tax=Sphaeroforma arctica JP610 TaxID=667725 RepID=A0A0L0GEK8_9EUKA|nr:hypothetical protein SARC_00432 [Sphaeroforma arctica JP610]KNC87450.1 hypothetical protein SARC_00432 [Sphaeroforma arctica JP610]|eukprot:XP_014161352.1 hypothetical protein SARC_00432 [Sphaeroforma arctica JP610]
MPRKRLEWDPVEMKGNPTRSGQVNDLLKAIERFETRGERNADLSKRPLKFDEIMSILTINIENTAFQDSGLHGLWTWTFQLICRVDDATNITYSNLKYNEDHPDEVFLEIARSKNIAKKSQVSRQVVLGSLDPYICALSALTAHIIDRLRGRSTFSNLDLGYMFTSNGSTGRDEKLRTDVSRSRIKKIISLPEFKAKGEINELGTHSMRKCSATYIQRRGLTKDHAEARGRWAKSKMGGSQIRGTRQVDTYSSDLMPFPDARVSEILCGPRGAYDEIRKVVLRVPVVTITAGADDFCAQEVEGISSNANPNATNVTELQNQIISLMAEVINLKQMLQTSEAKGCARIQQLRAELKRTRRVLMSQFNTMNFRARQIATSGNQPNNNDNANSESTHNNGESSNSNNSDNRPAELIDGPKSLRILWDEYERGINGNKPASLFTRAERGSVKGVYSFRLTFWRAMERLNARGNSIDLSIEKLYHAFGETLSIAGLIREIRKDKQLTKVLQHEQQQ